VPIFKDGKITSQSRFGEAGFAHRGEPAGSVATVAFALTGRQFTALKGGPRAPDDHGFMFGMKKFDIVGLRQAYEG